VQSLLKARLEKYSTLSKLKVLKKNLSTGQLSEESTTQGCKTKLSRELLKKAEG